MYLTKKKPCNDSPLTPPHTLHLLLTMSLLAAGNQLVVPRGVTHISCHYKNTIEGAGENRTNEQTLGVNLRAKRGVMQHYISDSIYGLTLAWITSENSTKPLECRLILTHCRWTLSHAASPLCFGVRCRLPLSVVPRQLSAPFSNQLSSRLPLPLPDTARSQVQNPLSGFAPKQTKESSAWRATYIVLQPSSFKKASSRSIHIIRQQYLIN